MSSIKKMSMIFGVLVCGIVLRSHAEECTASMKGQLYIVNTTTPTAASMDLTYDVNVSPAMRIYRIAKASAELKTVLFKDMRLIGNGIGVHERNSFREEIGLSGPRSAAVIRVNRNALKGEAEAEVAFESVSNLKLKGIMSGPVVCEEPVRVIPLSGRN